MFQLGMSQKKRVLTENENKNKFPPEPQGAQPNGNRNISQKNGSGSGLYSGGLTRSIVLRCDDLTGIFTCDGCARDPYFYVPAEIQSYVIKLSCSRKVLASSGDLTRHLWVTTISSQPRYPLR